MPKIGGRLPELDSYFCRTDPAVPTGEHDAAFLLFTTERVLQKKLLIRCYFGGQVDQCAMSIDHERVGSLRKRRTQRGGSVSDNGHS